MNKHVVKTGQNLYDIALTLYGSIEGIFDLLISNPNISFNTVFKTGMELNYHEDFIINQDIVSWLDENKVEVRNGKYTGGSVDVRSEIIAWIESNNKKISNKYLNGELKQVTAETKDTVQAYSWDETDTPSVTSTLQSGITTQKVGDTILQDPFTTQNKWEVQYIDKTTLTTAKDITKFANALSGLKLDKIASEDLLANLEVMYSNGMIALPSDESEKQFYYDIVSTAKIRIEQTGRSCAIGLQIPNNSFIAISWGDDTALDFYHYQQYTTNATHTYKDTGEHTITMYGDNKFTNLDFTNINGVYYALSEIYISNEFASPYSDEVTLNKLFIKKTAK